MKPAFTERTAEQILGSLNAVERKNAPPKLFLAGDLGLMDMGPRVSVVGSRRASPEAAQRARSLTRALVEREVIVVSGLAEGIDAEAHRSAIEFGGRTIAVIGTPLDQVYPTTHRDLQTRIMAEHLAISQFDLGTPVRPANFLLRNRTMALISDATVIVEAGPRSGTEHQGWEALRLGRLLFIMESLAQRQDLPWIRKMQHYGAQVLSRSNLDEFLSNLPERTRGDSVAF